SRDAGTGRRGPRRRSFARPLPAQRRLECVAPAVAARSVRPARAPPVEALRAGADVLPAARRPGVARAREESRMRIGGEWIAIVGLVSAASAPGYAVDHCVVKVNSKTNAIEVSASNVSGTPLWRKTAGGTTMPFADAATCVAGGKLKKCHLGTEGSD